MKKIFSFLLICLLLLSMTACQEEGDPLLSRLSKIENAAPDEAMADFTKAVYSLKGKTIDDFDIEKYTLDDSTTIDGTDTILDFYETYQTVCGQQNVKILLELKNKEFYSVSLFFPNPFSPEETEFIYAFLDSKYEFNEMVYLIKDDMVLLVLGATSSSSSPCKSFHYTILPPRE